MLDSKTSNPRPYLIAGLISSFSASVCCIGPFFLLTTGLSGAWMSRLMVVESYQPLLAVITIGAFALAGWKLFYAKQDDGQGASCSAIKPLWQSKHSYLLSACLALLLLSSEYWIVLIAQ